MKTLFLSVLFLALPLAFAQSTTATIFGTVSDSSGAIIPRAEVTAKNVDTNFKRTTSVGANGQYQFLFLPIGTYSVEATAAGFKKSEQKGIVLDVNRNARVDAVLQVGQISEKVEVTADAPLVETKVPVIGQTINNEDIENLPWLTGTFTACSNSRQASISRAKRRTISALRCRSPSSTARPSPTSDR